MGFFDAINGVSGPLGEMLSEYARNVMSGQIAANGAFSGPSYDQNKSFAQNVRDPDALQQAINIAIGVSGGGLGIKAYHGSPHDFEQFNQAPTTPGFYGQGTYFHLDKSDVEKYAPAGGKVYEADLNVSRPFKMTEPISAEDTASILRALGREADAQKTLQSGQGWRNGNELWYWGMGQNTPADTKAAALRAAGFDSIFSNPKLEMTGQSNRSTQVNMLDPSLIEILQKYSTTGGGI